MKQEDTWIVIAIVFICIVIAAVVPSCVKEMKRREQVRQVARQEIIENVRKNGIKHYVDKAWYGEKGKTPVPEKVPEH